VPCCVLASSTLKLTMKRVSTGTTAGSRPSERCRTLPTCVLSGVLSHSASHKSAGNAAHKGTDVSGACDERMHETAQRLTAGVL
jgi:hypothetical protein